MAEQDEEYGPRLYARDPDECCALRKIEPLERALDDYDAWAAGLRRDESPTRANTPVVGFEHARGKVKVTPIAPWTQADVDAYISRYDVPVNELLRPGLRVGRLLAVHPAHTARRRRARRPLADVRQDRVRAALVVSALLLVAHGSTDPRAAATTRALARVVRRQRPEAEVRVAYLDHAGPRPGAVLFELAARGHRSVTVVPLLLTAAYHGRVDLPAAIAAAQAGGLDIEVVLTDVLGPDPLLLAGLRRRLAQAVTRFDGLVLVAAGTRDPVARSTVDAVADDLALISGVPARAAFGSASAVTGAVAVEALRAAGCRRIAVASYFLARGKLYDAVTASAIGAGALAPPAQPLGDAPELAQLIRARATQSQLTAV